MPTQLGKLWTSERSAEEPENQVQSNDFCISKPKLMPHRLKLGIIAAINHSWFPNFQLGGGKTSDFKENFSLRYDHVSENVFAVSLLRRFTQKVNIRQCARKLIVDAETAWFTINESGLMSFEFRCCIFPSNFVSRQIVKRSEKARHKVWFQKKVVTFPFLTTPRSPTSSPWTKV